MQLRGAPSGEIILYPTCEGWQMYVGCWSGTPNELRNLISNNDGWPEALPEDIPRRRQYLEAALVMCDLFMADNRAALEACEKWSTEASDEEAGVVTKNE